MALKSAVQSGRVAARPARSAVVVRASAESRRAVLSTLFAGAALTATKSAWADATPVDLFDDRSARDRGFDIIYEARDLALPQNVRDGMTQARTSLDETVKRVKASESRIDATLPGFVEKAYWTEAREELRRQVGTLRFDLNTLATSKPDKAAKKAALAARSDFLAAVEALDLAIRKKNKDQALAKLTATQGALDKVLATVL